MFNNRRVVIITKDSQRKATFQYVIDRYNLTQEKIDQLIDSGDSVSFNGIEMWFDIPASYDDEWN